MGGDSERSPVSTALDSAPTGDTVGRDSEHSPVSSQWLKQLYGQALAGVWIVTSSNDNNRQFVKKSCRIKEEVR